MRVVTICHPYMPISYALTDANVKGIWTPTTIMEALRQCYPTQVFPEERYIFTTFKGYILDTAAKMQHAGVSILAYPDMNRGATTELAPLIKVANSALRGQLKTTQIRLLLRGEEGLANRVKKLQFDEERIKATLLTAAVKLRYAGG